MNAVSLIGLAFGLLIALIKPRWGFWVLLGLSMAYPGDFLLNPEVNQSLPVWIGDIPIVWIQMGCSLGLLPLIFKHENRKVVQQVLLPLAIFIVLFTLAGIIHGNDFKNIIAETGPLLSYVTISMIVLMVQSKRDLKRMLNIIIIFCTIASAGAIIEHAFSVGTLSRSYVEGANAYFDYTRDGKAQIDAFVFATFLVCLFLYPKLRSRVSFSGIILLLLSVINLYATILTLNRTMFICYVLLFFIAFLIIIKHGRIKVSSVLVVFVAVVGLITIINTSSSINPLLLGKFDDVSFNLDQYRQQELQLLDTAFDTPEHALIGVGAGQIWYLYVNNTYQLGNQNFYVQVIWKGGLIGVFLLLLFLNNYILHIRQKTNVLYEESLGGVAIWTYLLLVAFLVMGYSQNRFFSSNHIALIGVLIGLPFALERLAQAKSSEVLPPDYKGNYMAISAKVTSTMYDVTQTL